MAVSPVKVWIAGEVLTAADLVAEFANIYNNGESLGFPRTTTADFNGQKLDLDADADTSMRADTDDQIDFEIGGSDVIRFTSTQILVNGRRVLTAGELAREIGPVTVISSENRHRLTQLEDNHVWEARSFTF